VEKEDKLQVSIQFTTLAENSLAPRAVTWQLILYLSELDTTHEVDCTTCLNGKFLDEAPTNMFISSTMTQF
jgi:hypothetical protein